MSFELLITCPNITVPDEEPKFNVEINYLGEFIAAVYEEDSVYKMSIGICPHEFDALEFCKLVNRAIEILQEFPKNSEA